MIFGVALSLAFATYNVSVIVSAESAVTNVSLAKSEAIANNEQNGNLDGCDTVREELPINYFLYITYECVKGDFQFCLEGNLDLRQYGLEWEIWNNEVNYVECSASSCCQN